MSSFRRADKSSAAASTHASIRQHCVSSGLRELDSLMGGGISIGTLTLLSEDSFSNHAETLMNYMIAEACSQCHDLLIIACPTGASSADSVLSRLPMNLSRDADAATIAPELPPPAKEAAGGDLKIAWQYGKYLTKGEAPDSVPAVGQGRSQGRQHHGRQQFCHSYDLARRLQESIITGCKVDVYTPAACKRSSADRFQSSGTLDSFLDEVFEHIRAYCESGKVGDVAVGVPGKRNPLRIFMPSLGGLDRHFSRRCQDSDNRFKVLRFFMKIKHLVRNRDKCVTVVMSTNPSCYPDDDFLPGLCKIVDSAFIVESFDGHGNTVPFEYRHFCAFFHVLKLSNCYSLTPYHPPSNHYGIQRDSRKLLIELLHLPPEEGDEPDSSGKPLTSGQSCSASVTSKLNEI